MHLAGKFVESTEYKGVFPLLTSMSIHTTIESNIHNLDDLTYVLNARGMRWNLTQNTSVKVVEATMNGGTVTIRQDGPGRPFVFTSYSARDIIDPYRSREVATNSEAFIVRKRAEDEAEQERLRKLAETEREGIRRLAEAEHTGLQKLEEAEKEGLKHIAAAEKDGLPTIAGAEKVKLQRLTDTEIEELRKIAEAGKANLRKYIKTEQDGLQRIEVPVHAFFSQ